MRTRLPILLVTTLLTACNAGDIEPVAGIDAHSGSHSHGSISGVRDGVWPPEPLNMQDQQQLPANLQPRARQSVIDIARRSVMNNPALLEAIGENYGTFDASLSVAKSDNVASFIFYNYDTDYSVEATLLNDGQVAVSKQPASEWQPTENALEVQKAIDLARNSLEADGFALNTLEATAMLTYPPQASSGASTAVFYDTRMLYVTFGVGDGEPPVYSARVDIGTGVISEGGPMQ